MSIQLLITPRGSIDAEMQNWLREEGVVVVETANPADVKLLLPSSGEIGAGPLLYAALSALKIGSDAGSISTAKDAFVEAVFSEVKAERERTQSEWVKLPPRDAQGKFAKAAR